MNATQITTLFLDIGGVLLTNSWDRHARQRAVEHFHLDTDELGERHHLTFDTYESGKLSLDQYLDRLVFYEDRPFSREEFKEFIYAQSHKLEGSLEYFNALKSKYHLNVVAVSNEGRELNAFRTKKFKLNKLFDAFISSSFVHFRKPDADMYHIACDVSQASPGEVLYMDDRLMFVQVASSLGLNGYHYQGLEKAKNFMQSIDFQS